MEYFRKAMSFQWTRWSRLPTPYASHISNREAIPLRLPTNDSSAADKLTDAGRAVLPAMGPRSFRVDPDVQGRSTRSHCPYNLVTIAVKEFLLAWLELPFASCALNPRLMKQTGIMLSGNSKTLRVSSGKCTPAQTESTPSL